MPASENFYPFNASTMGVLIRDENLEVSHTYEVYADELNKYHIHNEQLYGIRHINFVRFNNELFTFPYNPDRYDYYFIGTLVANCSDDSLSTYKPASFDLPSYDVDTHSTFSYPLSDVNIYDIDSLAIKGFGFSFKVDFAGADNVGIIGFNMMDDVHGLGNKPPDLVFEAGILAIEKGQSETAVMSQILNQLQNMENSFIDSIGSAADQVTDAIENQYGMTPGESFGVQDITSQVEDKLGVLSFGADTLNNFLGLFQASSVGSTVLTFPGFTIDVQGHSYQVWNDIQFDLAFLEENFGFLIDTVRTVTVLCVWLAVLGYLVKAYEHLVNNKG